MPPWPDFELPPLGGQRIFLTGGTGFVGKSLLDYFDLVAQRHGADFEVCVLSRDPRRFLDRNPQYTGLAWLKFVEGDLLRLPTGLGAFTGMIHAAADTHGVASGAQWIDQIVSGTRAALDFALAHGSPRFLSMSSGAVYGPQPAHLSHLAEDYGGAPPTTAPGSVYGQAKRLAEQLCTVYCQEQGLQTVTARCFSLVSEHVPLAGPYAIGNFIGDALAGGPLRIKGDGNTVRSYLYGLDMAHWVLTLLRQGAAGQAYNVGSDIAISIRQLAELVAATLAPEARIECASVALVEAGQRSVYVPDITRCRQLGLEVTTPLQRAIQRSADWIRSHPAC